MLALRADWQKNFLLSALNKRKRICQMKRPEIQDLEVMKKIFQRNRDFRPLNINLAGLLLFICSCSSAFYLFLFISYLWRKKSLVYLLFNFRFYFFTLLHWSLLKSQYAQDFPNGCPKCVSLVWNCNCLCKFFIQHLVLEIGFCISRNVAKMKMI